MKAKRTRYANFAGVTSLLATINLFPAEIDSASANLGAKAFNASVQTISTPLLPLVAAVLTSGAANPTTALSSSTNSGTGSSKFKNFFVKNYSATTAITNFTLTTTGAGITYKYCSLASGSFSARNTCAAGAGTLTTSVSSGIVTLTIAPGAYYAFEAQATVNVSFTYSINTGFPAIRASRANNS